MAGFQVSAEVLTAFIQAGRRRSDPIVDLSLFRRGSFCLPAVTLTLSFICGYLLNFLLPFYLIQSRRMHPAAAGLLLATNGTIRVITAPLSGYLSDRVGSKAPATFGIGVLAVGSFLLSRLGDESPIGMVAAGIMTAGCGVGIFVPPNNSMLMSAVPRARHGIASGVLATSRAVGMAIGVALAGAVRPNENEFAIATVIALIGTMTSAAPGLSIAHRNKIYAAVKLCENSEKRRPRIRRR